MAINYNIQRICKFICFTLLFLIIYNVQHVRAQDLIEAKLLRDVVNELFNEGKYEEAIPLAEKVITLMEQQLGKDHAYVAPNLKNLAEIYRAMRRYSEAEPLYKRALAILEKQVDKDIPYYVQTLNNVAEFYNEQGRYNEAELLYKKSLAISEQHFGADNREVAIVLNSLAQLYQMQGHYKNAEPLYKRSLTIIERQVGKGDPAVGACLINLAGLYKDQSRYDEAEPLYKRSLTILEQHFGKNDKSVAVGLNNLAGVYEELGRYEEAEPLYQRSLEIMEQQFGRDHPNVATCLNNLAMLNHAQGRYDEAESLYQRSLAIDEKNFGKEHLKIATSLNNIAGLYQDQGRYNEAEPLYKRSLAIKEHWLGKDHPDVATCLNNLAGLYYAQGRYREAEPLYIRSLAIKKKRFSKDHPDIAQIQNNLALLYQAQGRNNEAEALYQQSMAIWNHQPGIDNPDVASNQNNLAMLYQKQGRYDEAEQLYKQSLAESEQQLGKDHPDVATSLNNLAILYNRQGRYSEAETLYKRSLSIMEKHLGKDHPDVAVNLNNLALSYQIHGRYNEAVLLYKRSLAILEQQLGKDHPNVGVCLNNLGSLLAASGKHKEALDYINRGLVTDEITINDVFSGASERNKYIFLETLNARQEILFNLIQQQFPNDKESIFMGLDIVLRRKGFVLDALAREKMALLMSDTPEAVQMAEDMQRISNQIASLTLTSTGKIDSKEYKEQLNQLRSDKEIVEQKIANLSQVYRIDKAVRKADHIMVAKQLPSNSVLIEIISFRTVNFNALGENMKWGENQYLAFILPSEKNSQPKLIQLGAADEIDNAVREFRSEMEQATELAAQQGEIEAGQKLAQISKKIYKLVFLPIEKSIKNVNTIFLSPDSDLNLVPFGALIDTTNTYLAEKYNIDYVSSGRDFIRFGENIKRGRNFVIMADPDFNASSNLRRRQANAMVSKSSQSSLRASNLQRSIDLKDVKWTQLPATRTEAEVISELFAEKTNTKIYLGLEALEESFKKIKSPRILHIATHGFFLQDIDKSQRYEEQEQFRGFQLADNSPITGKNNNIENPLLRSGLVLAGANNLGKEVLPNGVDDGILTAYEISGMNLWGTDLVVLSACETGLGEIQRGEGVFGLRRAFQIAGAKTLVMSLWKVPDKETQELMVEFYKRLKNRESKADALHNAQRAMIKYRREKYGVAHPLYWGAFVCVGDPGNLAEIFKIDETEFAGNPMGNAVTNTIALKLRSEAMELSSKDLIAMLNQLDFFDNMRNPKGCGIMHKYEKEKIDGDEVVIDKTTGLMWQQSGSSKKMDDDEAIAWIKELNQKTYAGFNDWRIPTLEETMSIMEAEEMKKPLHIDPIFNNKQTIIWASDVKPGSFDKTWFTNYETGESPYSSEINKEFYIKAVRNIEDK